MKSLTLTVKQLWPRLMFVFLPAETKTDRQTVTERTKLDAPKFHSRCIKIHTQTVHKTL